MTPSPLTPSPRVPCSASSWRRAVVVRQHPRAFSITAASRAAFTLIELLVVIAIIAILIGMLAPVLEKATERARLAACAENLHHTAVALNTYAGEFNNVLPLRPASPSTLDPARPCRTIGNHQVWIGSLQKPSGLGLLTAGGWLADPRALVCPSDDDPNAKPSIAPSLATPAADTWSSYAYRQLDQTTSDRINTPGTNAAGQPAKALLLDWQSEGPAPYLRNSHDYNEYLNIMYADGHVQGFSQSAPFQVTASDYAAMPASYLKRLDQLWVTADWAESSTPATAPKLP